MSVATVRTDTLLHVVATCANAIGESPAMFAERAQVSFKQLQREPRVSVEWLHRVWGRAVKVRPKALPALVGQSLPLEKLGALGFCLLTAPTAMDALRFAVRSYPLVNERAQWDVHLSQQAQLLFTDPMAANSLGDAASREAMASHLISGIRRIVGPNVALGTVRFQHRAPEYAREYAAQLQCAVRWDEDQTSIELCRDALESVPSLANKETHTVLIRHIEQELLGLRSHRGIATVLASKLRQSPESHGVAVAAQVHMSERTLRRKLAAESASLRGVRDTVRAEQAWTQLTQTQRSITHIALELGFADPSTFARAFKRWHGCTPSEARKKQTI